MIKHLRQHSKIVLAIVCVVLMLAWLVLPSIEQAFQAGGGGSQPDPVKVTWKGGRLKASELQHMRVVHKAAVEFVTGVIREALQKKGNPHGPGVNVQLGMIGISQWHNDIDQEQGTLVETMILAQHARELGVTANDETVKEFLRKLGDYALDEGDLAEQMDRAIPESGINISPTMIFEHLKTEILAQQARLMLQAGIDHIAPGEITPIGNRPMQIFFGGSGALPPGEMWQAYERLHRRVEIEAFPLHVKDFVGKVTKEPSEAELKELFEEGRTRLANPAYPQPGFMQPHKVAFQHIKADLEPFLEAAKLEITEEQIAKAYEEGKARGEFKVEEPPAPMPGDKPAEKPAEDPANPNEPKDPAVPGDKPATDKPATDKAATDKPATEKPDDKPEPKEADTKQDAAKSDDAKKDDTKKNDAKKDAAKPEPKKNEGSALARDVQLVNFQEDDKKPTDDDKKPADKKPTEVKPAEVKPAEAKPADAKPAEDKPADPADTKPADPADPTAKPADKPAEKEVKFKPLEEVKDEIRTNLARPIASDRRQALIEKVFTAVNTYSRQYNRWKAYTDREKEIKEEGGKPPKNKIEKPAPLDLSSLLADSSLKVESIPLVDQFEVQEMVDQPQDDGTTKKVPKYEIGVRGTRFFERDSATFAQFAFSTGGSLYQPETLPFAWEQKQFMGGIDGTLWIFWRTDEQQAKELDFAAARDEVLAHWKEQEALKLAQEEAKKLAAQAGQGKDLKSLVAKPEQIITPPAFSWLSTGLTQFGLPSPSEITGIQYAGNDFRRDVFDLQVGQAGVALDQPQTTVYVVKVLGEEGISVADRQRFLEKGADRELLDAAWQSQVHLQSDLYSELFKQYDVTWLPSTDEDNS